MIELGKLSQSNNSTNVILFCVNCTVSYIHNTVKTVVKTPQFFENTSRNSFQLWPGVWILDLTRRPQPLIRWNHHRSLFRFYKVRARAVRRTRAFCLVNRSGISSVCLIMLAVCSTVGLSLNSELINNNSYACTWWMLLFIYHRNLTERHFRHSTKSFRGGFNNIVRIKP